jgi:hypothetical protein
MLVIVSGRRGPSASPGDVGSPAVRGGTSCDEFVLPFMSDEVICDARRRNPRPRWEAPS